jgi:4-hydroxythreonine-4-phosphate dehydrogenase
VVLATLHIPYHQVLRDLTVESLYHTLLLTQAFFATPRRPQPRIAVAGLNPHAGEDGLFGDEETTIIKPAIERLKGVNPHIFGPFPADSLFKAELRRSYDVFVAQTHDQGLIAIKTLFGIKCVNVTLGLPYIRTSVGHGTAYDIAADCKADPNGMIEAIREADRLVKARPPAAPVHPSQRRR